MNRLISIIVIIIISCCLLILSFSKPSFTLRSPNPHAKSLPKFDVDCFCKLLGNKSRERSATGEIVLLMAVITRIYGQTIPMLFEHNSYICTKGRSINALQSSPYLCNAF